MHDLGRGTVGQFARPAPGPRRHQLGGMTGQALGEDHAVGSGDLHGVIGVEATRHRHHPGGEQRRLSLH